MNGGENSDFDGSRNSDVQKSDRQKRGFIGSRRYRAPSDEQKYAAASNLANNPNTPDFFSDAVMANTAVPQPRKSHKRLIFIIVAIIIAIAIALSLFFIFSTLPQKANNNPRVTFNRFANYLLYGNDSDNDINEGYSLSLYYYGDDKNTDKKAYLKNVRDKFINFHNAYNNSEHTHPDMNTTIEEYEYNLTLLYYFEEKPLLSSSRILSYYLENKAEARNRIFSEYPNPETDLGESVNSFVRDYRNDSYLLLDTITALDEKGCVDHDTEMFSPNCINDEKHLKLTTYDANIREKNNQIIQNRTNLFKIRAIKEYVYEKYVGEK